MMSRVAIFSDSHYRDDLLDDAIEYAKSYDINAIIHCGDIEKWSAFELMKETKLPYFVVYGNNDFLLKIEALDDSIKDEPYEFTFSSTSFKIMHMPYFLNNINSDITIYGHTHIQKIEQQDRRLILNPGEICGRDTHFSSFMVLEIDKLYYKIWKIKRSLVNEGEFEEDVVEIRRER